MVVQETRENVIPMVLLCRSFTTMEASHGQNKKVYKTCLLAAHRKLNRDGTPKNVIILSLRDILILLFEFTYEPVQGIRRGRCGCETEGGAGARHTQ